MADEVLELKFVADAEDVIREIKRVRDEQTKLVDGVRVLNNVSREEAKASRDRMREIAGLYTEQARRVAEATNENVRQIQTQRDETIRGIRETLLANTRAAQQEHATTLGLIRARRAAIVDQIEAQKKAATSASQVWNVESQRLAQLERQAKEATTVVRNLERQFDNARTDRGRESALSRIDAAKSAQVAALTAYDTALKEAQYKKDAVNHETAALQKLRQTETELTKEEALLRQQLGKNVSIYKQDAEEKIQQTRHGAADSIRAVQNEGQERANNYKNAAQEASLASQQIGRALNESNAQLREHIAGVNQMGQAWQRAGFAIAGVGTVLTGAITAPTVAALQAGTGFNEMRENADLAFSVILKSGSQAKDLIEQLYQFALPTAFEFENVTTGAQKLVAAGYQVKEIIPILRDAGNAAALGGGGSADPGKKIDQIVDAFAKIRNRGVLQLRELNRITPIISFQKILDEYNKLAGTDFDRDKFNAAMKKKQISAELGSEAIRRAIRGITTDENGLDLLARQADTYSGLMATVADVTKKALGDVTLPLFEAIKEVLRTYIIPGITALASYITGLSPVAQRALVIFVGLAAAVGPLLILVGGLVAFIGTLVTAVAAFAGSVVYLTGAATVLGAISSLLGSIGAILTTAFFPVTAILIGITAAVAALYIGVSAYWEDFKAGFTNVATLMTQLWETASNNVKDIAATSWAFIIQLFEPVKTAIIQTFGIVVQWFRDNWPLIAETVRNSLELMFTIVKTVGGAIASFWALWGETIMGIIGPLWNAIVTTVQTALYLILEVVSLVLNIINGNWEAAFRNLGEITGAVLRLIVNLVSNILKILWNVVKGSVTAIINLFINLYDWGYSAGYRFMNWLLDLWRGGLDNIINAIWAKVLDMKNAAASFWNAFWSGTDQTSGVNGPPVAIAAPPAPPSQAAALPEAPTNPYTVPDTEDLGLGGSGGSAGAKARAIPADRVEGALNKIKKAVDDLKASLGLLDKEALGVLIGDFTHLGELLARITQNIPPIGASFDDVMRASGQRVEDLNQALATLRIHSAELGTGEFLSAQRKNATEEAFLNEEFIRKYVDTHKASTSELEEFKKKTHEQRLLKDLQAEQKLAEAVFELNRKVADTAFENDPYNAWAKSLEDLRRKQEDFKKEMYDKFGGGGTDVNPFAALRDKYINDYKSNTDAANAREQVQLQLNLQQRITDIRLAGSREVWANEEIQRDRAREAFIRDEASKIQNAQRRADIIAAYDEAVETAKATKIANYSEDLANNIAKARATSIIDPDDRREALLVLEATNRYTEVLREFRNAALAAAAEEEVLRQGHQAVIDTLAQSLDRQFRTPLGKQGATNTQVITLAHQLKALKLSIDDVNNAFGGATNSARVFELRLQSLEAKKAGKNFDAIKKGVKAVTLEFFTSSDSIRRFGTSIGEALGSALAGTESFASAMKKVMFGLIADLAQSWADYFFSLAIADLWFNPALAAAEFAAGVALTALASFLRAQGGSTAATPANSGGGGGSTASTSQADNRARPITRVPFDTSNERTITIKFESDGSGKMVDAMVKEFGIVTIDNAGREHRQHLRKKLR